MLEMRRVKADAATLRKGQGPISNLFRLMTGFKRWRVQSVNLNKSAKCIDFPQQLV